MKQLFNRTSCIVLAAGNSARMGRHKALLRFDSSKTFIQKIAETYANSGVGQIIIVVNVELYKLMQESNIALSEKVLLVINAKPELGRFYSLQTGMNLIAPGNSCFFQNVDNPYISEDVLGEIIVHKDQAEVILPVFQNRSGHPVLINNSVVQKIMLNKVSDIRIDEFLKTFKTVKVETADSNILLNINSKEEYRAAGFEI
jgi:molybdenum cofactor cytidylyltransferase